MSNAKNASQVANIIEARHFIPKIYAGETAELKAGEVIFIKPSSKNERLGGQLQLIAGNSSALPQALLQQLCKLGDIEISPGQSTYMGWSSSFASLGLPLRHLLGRKNIIFPDLIIELRDDSIVLNKTGNKWPTAGNFAYVTDIVAQNGIASADDAIQKAIASAGKEGVIIAGRLGESIEALGKSIEKATITAKDALTESTKNLSDAVILATANLDSTLTHATKVFENSVKFLGLTAQGMSIDMTQNVRLITSSLNRASNDLRESITEASHSLERSSQNISQAVTTGIRDASRSFESAFATLSHALTDSSSNIGQAIEEASRNFIEGMRQIKVAADAMSDTNHNVDFLGIGHAASTSCIIA